MQNIRVEFPADRQDIAEVMGKALLEIAGVSTQGPADLTTEAMERQAQVDAEAAYMREHFNQNNEGDPIGGDCGGEPDLSKAPSVFSDEPKAAGDTRTDVNGVQFDERFCANAADPFYGTGKQKGQWKKKRGVDEAEYVAWYGSQLGDTVEQAPAAEVNTASAFGGAQVQEQQAPAADAPKDGGTFMHWVAEKQGNGLLEQAAIDAAYTAAGVGLNDLFPPTAPEAVAANIAKVHAILAQQAGA